MAGDQDVNARRDAYAAARDVHVHQAPPSAPKPKDRIWGGVPARNPAFTGRDDLLARVRAALAAGDRVAVQALHGMGGVGKTQLAAEYAHRFAADYDIVWWLSAESTTLLGDQFAALALELACAAEDAQLDQVRRAVLTALRARSRWLVVFDNAERPDDIAAWLPGGPGHVLITSRSSRWDELAATVSVDLFTRAESVAAIRARVPFLKETDAARVADAVGDLPLAVAQAAGYLAYTGIPPAEYVRLLAERPLDLMDQGRPWSYPRSLAAATTLSYDQMRAEDPAAAAVIAIAAFLAPEPLPPEWFPAASGQLPAPLGPQAADPVSWRQLLYRLSGSALIRGNPDGLLMHRLTQAVIRAALPPESAATIRASAETLVIANVPGDYDLPATWPAWATLLPHLVALDPAATENTGVRNVALRVAWYLICRGDDRAARDLARPLYDQWRIRLDPDDDTVLWAATTVAEALRALGRPAEARELDEDTLGRRRRVLGEDHPSTLTSANNLALALSGLREHEAARALHEDTLARRRRVLGEDHPSTLSSANNLAGALYMLDEYAAARALDEGTLERRRRVLGEDHPDTLHSVNNLAGALYMLGEYAAARALHEDTLERRRRVLGKDHPSTLTSANNLASDLYMLGEYAAARALHEDTLERRRRVLGGDHPDTMKSAKSLARDLRALGQAPPGRSASDGGDA